MQPIASTSNSPQTTGVSAPAAPASARPLDLASETGQAEASQSQINQAIEAANAALKRVTNDLEFFMDSATGKAVVRVIDGSTGQVLRQFPSAEMLAIARALDRFQGMLIKQKA